MAAVADNRASLQQQLEKVTDDLMASVADLREVVEEARRRREEELAHEDDH